MNLICGINPVLEALNAGTRHFERLLVVKGLRNRRIGDAIAAASRLGVPLRFEARETLDRLSDGVPHQGIMAVVSARGTLELHELLEQTRDPALLVVLDGVEDPRNLGAILRTAEVAGADGVVLPQRHSAGLNETVARSSAGALEYVKVARVGNLAQALEALKQRNVWVVGFDAAGQERWDAVDLKRPVALVLGGEGRGIRRLVREKCDHLVSLPVFGHVTSLNVSVAAGIALYEVIRQRGLVPSHVRPIPPRPSHAAPAGVVGPRPDDAEHDPGLLVPVPAAAAWDENGAESGAELPEEERTGLVRLHDEETAWGGGGATVVKGGVQRRGRWGNKPPRDARHRRRPRPSGPGADRPDRAPAPAEAGPQAEGVAAPRTGGDDERRRRRKRRRGRERPPQAAAGVAGAPAGSMQGGEPRGDSAENGRRSQESGANGENGPSAPAGSSAVGPRGRRRGRRRRRGRPGPPSQGGPTE